MRIVINVALAALGLTGTTHQAIGQSEFPAWAYPWAPDFKAAPDDGIPRRVPDSDATFTVTQERDLFFVPDWHPADHPLMPDAVARGRRPVKLSSDDMISLAAYLASLKP